MRCASSSSASRWNGSRPASHSRTVARKAIIDTVKQGAGELLNTLFPQDWARAKDLEPYDYNPDKAKQLLTDAGWDA
ncbi:hypothetical protein EN806_55310, partial [bacterium M00.F.Ca.ET.163.01.1.1]